MVDHVMGGVGYNARDLFTPGQQTPSALGGSTGMHMATVVDDIDEAGMGRVWVYVPGISAPNPNMAYARYAPSREPQKSDGSPGAPIPEKRSGFIQAIPLTPHSGSDRLREKPNQPDGRNPNIGQSNSYGDFAQSRNGDLIAVCFMNGDPGKCYIMGHVPKTAETDMIPGHKPAQTNASGSGVSTNIGPSYEKGDDNKDQRPASLFFNNLTDAGLIGDPVRGCGTSSSTRESPSRVRGMETPGDPDSTMAGHQIIMDDHPDSQLVRLRTSKGAQLLLSDTGDFIYMSTQTGKSWVQIDNAGNCKIFAHSSVSIHSEQDFNMVCDRDFNLEVRGNANWNIKGDTRLRMNKGGNITAGEGGGDLDITTINNFHVKTQGEIRMGAKTGITAKSDSFLAVQSTQDTTILSKKALNTSAQTTSQKSSEGHTIQSGGELGASGKTISMASKDGPIKTDSQGGNTEHTTGGMITVPDAAFIQIPPIGMAATRFGATPSSDDEARDPNQADIPTLHSVAGPPSTSGPPTSPSSMEKCTAPCVPQHEPYNHESNQKAPHDMAVDP